MKPTSSTRYHEWAAKADEAEAQRQLYEGCHTSTYRRVAHRLELLMKISQQRLVSESEWAGERCASKDRAGATVEQQEGRPSPLSNLLCSFTWSQFVTSLGSTGRFARPQHASKTTPLYDAAADRSARDAQTLRKYFVDAHTWILVALIVRNVILLKTVIMAAILSRRDYLRGHIELDLRQNATLSEDRLCMLKEDIRLVGDNLASFEEHEKLTYWVQFMGVSFLSVPGLAAILIGLLSGLWVTLHATSMICFRLCRVRADHLCFIFDPIRERLRIKQELQAIVRDLIVSLFRRCERAGSNFSSSWTSSHFRQPSPPNRRRILAKAHDEQHSRLDRTRYVQLLILVQRLQLVKPYCVTSEWHRRLVQLIGRLIWCFFLLNYGTITILFIGLIVQDLYETARLRVADLACRQWNPNGTQTAMLDSAHLEPLDTRASSAAAYGSAHDGSVMSILKLALTVEASSYFSLKRVVFILEIQIGIMFICLLACRVSLVFTSGLLNKIAWLWHLEKEINLAAEESAKHAKRQTKDHKSCPVVDSQEHRLLKTLTVAYLHYEIFRRQEREFRVFARCNLIIVTAMVAALCTILYLMAVNFRTLNRIVVIYLYIATLALVNSFLLAVSYKAKQVERVKRKVAQIVAHCAASRPLQTSYALELWRRQLRFDHIESDVFGEHISYESVISFNFYTTATLLLLYRVAYHIT